MSTDSPVISKGVTGYAHLLNPRPWYTNTRLIILNFWISLLLISSTATGYDASLMNGLQSLTQWNQAFDYPTQGKLGLLTAIQSIGSLCACPFGAYVADIMGRRFSVTFGASLLITATAIQTASQSVEMFLGARFMVGFGLAFAATGAPILIAELAYPSYRGEVTSLYNTLWYLGSITAAWITYGTSSMPTSWAWRIPSALQAFSSVIQVLSIWFVPESPRWLVSKGKEERALQTLAYYHANGNAQDPLVEYEFEEIKAAIAFDREVVANVGWMSFIRHSGNRKRLRVILAIAVFSQWSGNGLIFYYLNKVFAAIGITNTTTQLLFNGLLNIFNLIVAIAGGLCCERMGRRPLFLTSCAGMIIFWTAETVSFSIHQQTGSVPAAHAAVVFIFFFNGFCEWFVYFVRCQIAFPPLITSYTVEILPLPLRAKGYSLFLFVVSLSLVFNQYVNPIALEVLQWKYYLVYLFWQCFQFVFCYFFIVETKNRTLEETAAIFDGDEGVVGIRDEAAARMGLTHYIEEKVNDAK